MEPAWHPAKTRACVLCFFRSEVFHMTYVMPKAAQHYMFNNKAVWETAICSLWEYPVSSGLVFSARKTRAALNNVCSHRLFHVELLGKISKSVLSAKWLWLARSHPAQHQAGLEMEPTGEAEERDAKEHNSWWRPMEGVSRCQKSIIGAAFYKDVQKWNLIKCYRVDRLDTKDVRANCFCASLLRTQIHMPRHARAHALSHKINKW